MIDYHWPTIKKPGLGRRSLSEYISSFLKTAEDKMYAHYGEKAQALKRYLIPSLEFPYQVLIEESYYVMDEYSDILWKTLGPAHGECSKHNQRLGDTYGTDWVCPGVAVDHNHYLDMWNSASHNNYWKTRYPKFEDFLEHVDEGPVAFDHSHVGDWQHLWLVKTGYDFGLQIYRFRRERDLTDFVLKISLGPQFEAMEK